ncbi:MAG: hypothetical protein HYR71_12475 [Chloroflexi bacterium]|nr:hypothetical protein [Chloroflexota bacterium]
MNPILNQPESLEEGSANHTHLNTIPDGAVESEPYDEYTLPFEELPHFEISPKTQRRKAMTGRRRSELAAQVGGSGARDDFHFTFKAARFEEEWLIAYLKVFYDDHLITDVLRQVKGGKEATVYCCKAHPKLDLDLVAVKVYRPRRFRNLRNDAQYRQGRTVLDDQGKGVRAHARREQHAMQKKTHFGQELLHGSWLAHEYRTLQKLYAAGVDVPRPIAQSENAILMEYLGEEGESAPALQDVNLSREEVRPLFERVMRNIALMLGQDRVHGDLSAYNVLYWAGEVKLIDFPQAVDPYVNPDARQLFNRDVQRICQYFARYKLRADASELAQTLWQEHTMVGNDL